MAEASSSVIPPIPTDGSFDCQGLEHAFDTVDQCDVARIEGGKFFDCDRQPCPNRYPRSVPVLEQNRFEPIRRTNQHPAGPQSTHASRASSRIPARVGSPAPVHTPVRIATPPRNPTPPPPNPPPPAHRGRQGVPPGRQYPPPPPAPSPSPPPDPPTMTDATNNAANKLLLPKEYDGEGANGAKVFVAQCKKYFRVVPFVDDETRILVVLNRLTGKAADWATHYIVAIVDNETSPFANKEAFYNTFLARFAHVDDTAAAQIELDNLLKKGSIEGRSVAEYSAAFTSIAERTDYGATELLVKYRSGLPSRVYREIKLEKFTTWKTMDKRALEVEQLLNLDRERRPQTTFFRRGKGKTNTAAAATVASSSTTTPTRVGDGTYPGDCFGCGKKGYRRFECPNCKDKPYQKKGKTAVRATVAATATTSAPADKTTEVDLAALLAEMKALRAASSSMKEELEQLRALKESEGF